MNAKLLTMAKMIVWGSISFYERGGGVGKSICKGVEGEKREIVKWVWRRMVREYGCIFGVFGGALYTQGREGDATRRKK